MKFISHLSLSQLEQNIVRYNNIRNSGWLFYVNSDPAREVILFYHDSPGILLGLSPQFKKVFVLISTPSSIKELKLFIRSHKLTNIFLVIGNINEGIPFRKDFFREIYFPYVKVFGKEYKDELIKFVTGHKAKYGNLLLVFRKNTVLSLYKLLREIQLTIELINDLNKLGLRLEYLLNLYPCVKDTWLIEEYIHQKKSVSLFIKILKLIFFRKNVGLYFKDENEIDKSIYKEIKSEYDNFFRKGAISIDKQYLGSGDSNVFVSDEVIIRVPVSEYGLSRCLNNFTALKELGQLHLQIATPQPLYRFSNNGRDFFYESRLPGRELSYRNAKKSQKDGYNSQVVSFLTDLNKKSIETKPFTITKLKSSVVKHTDNIVGYLDKNIAEKLTLFEKNVNKYWLNRQFDFVYLHGDFKFGNFLWDKKDRLSGVIDWDQSENSSFPLMDLLVYFAYNHWTLSNEHIGIFLSKDINKFRIIKQHGLEEYLSLFSSLNEKDFAYIYVLTIIYYYSKNIVDGRLHNKIWVKKNIQDPLTIALKNIGIN